MREELHIAGIVVHARADSAAKVAAAITARPGAEIHAASPDGKMVVTLEAATAREIGSRIEEIQGLEAVLSASLVYQHGEPLEAMMEEIPHEDHQA